jgi:amidase
MSHLAGGGYQPARNIAPSRPGKRRLTLLLMAAIPLALCLHLQAQASRPVNSQAPDLSGSWELTWIRFGEANVDRVQLQLSGDKITGKVFGNLNIEGNISGDKVELKVIGDDKKTIATLNGTVRNGEMSGDMKLFGDNLTWTARRARVRPPETPRVHNFDPKEFHNYFSATIPPALRIYPGDTVHTETVDAGGVDKDGKRRSLGGNPLTGPFYVEGAVRGDTLVVHFNRIRLNRDRAQSGSTIALSALNPGYVQDKKYVPDFDSAWRLDKERGVAMLAKPTDKLKDFVVPLQPMLGCVGVAPPRNQSFLSGDLGSYGGNMDYNQVIEGVTLYFPVNQAGALLYVGDGHAAQGDGELTGDALETSMEVEFTVDLIQGKSFGGPRAENDEYIMAIGIANSLPEAVQRATTQLARWIEDDYKLNPSEIAVVLGFAIHYDIAELVDPHINVVAKIRKSALARIRKGDN